MKKVSEQLVDEKVKGSKKGTRFMRTMGLIEMINRPIISTPDDGIDSKVCRRLRFGEVYRHRSSAKFITPDQIEPEFLGRAANKSNRIDSLVWGSYHGNHLSPDDRILAGSSALQEIRDN